MSQQKGSYGQSCQFFAPYNLLDTQSGACQSVNDCLGCLNSKVPVCHDPNLCRGGNWVIVCDGKAGEYKCHCSAYQ